jgi:hypothetical protein
VARTETFTCDLCGNVLAKDEVPQTVTLQVGPDTFANTQDTCQKCVQAIKADAGATIAKLKGQ